ncbi:unnamed protein product [Urochloa humidicola]
MAVAGTAFPAPAPRSLTPPARNIVARLVRSRLAWAAANAVMCLCLASILLHFAAAGASCIGLVACADGSPVAAAVSGVRIVSLDVFVCSSASSRCLCRPQRRVPQHRGKEGSGSEERCSRR